MEDRNRKLMIEGNAFYEIDLECMSRKQRGESCCRQKEKEAAASSKKKPKGRLSG